MNGTINVMRRELAGYFATPVAYVFSDYLPGDDGHIHLLPGRFLRARLCRPGPVLPFPPVAVPVPGAGDLDAAVGRGAASGTIELLFTLPVTTFQAVAGQVPGGLAVYRPGAGADRPDGADGQRPGFPGQRRHPGGVPGQLADGGWVPGHRFCMSALTRNQVMAFVLSVVVCFLFLLSGLPMVMNLFKGWAPQVFLDGIASLSVLRHFADISKGVIDLRDLVYFVLMTGFWLLANVLILDMKKAD